MVLLISACTSRDIYYDKNFNPPVYFGSHVVRKGDTLYSIAWRYGREFKELARANNISPPYIIRPGQKIHLELDEQAMKKISQAKNVAPAVKKNVTKSKQSVESTRIVTKAKKYNEYKDIIWQWPHVGPILATYRFSANQQTQKNTNKGIDIGGALGDPVRAAASGEVVYAGNGLLGYGNLVIIKHNATYLSAYAHNKRILVKEEQSIKAGQKIAELGNSGAEKPMLHFEIRKNGQPVDPLKLLPNNKTR